MKISEETKLRDIYNLQCLERSRDYLIGNGAALFQKQGELTLQQLNEAQPTWYAKDMAFGLNRLVEIAENKDKEYFYQVYSPEEIERESEKKDVKLFHFPGTEKGRFAILLSGGAYGAVASIQESFPIAAKLNKLGITAFCLNYRVYQPEMSALLPKPMDDLAAAYRFIEKHADEFEIDPTQYLVAGFSAGGHVAAEWGTLNMGARKYNLPLPEMLMLGYPLITTEKLREFVSEDFWKVLFKGMFGENYTKEDENQYSVNQHVDKFYPTVYLVHSQNDDAVPFHNLVCMAEALKKAGITFETEGPETGGHGFGLGTGTELEGWVERAVRFWNSCRRHNNL